MKQIVIISKKAGVGKSTITARLTKFCNKDIILADFDIENPRLHKIIPSRVERQEDFKQVKTAKINESKCINCGYCFGVCDFNSIDVLNGQHTVNESSCTACGHCEEVCPTKAINHIQRSRGNYFISKTGLGQTLIHTKISANAKNKESLIKELNDIVIKTSYNQNTKTIVINAKDYYTELFSESDLIIFLTEPTFYGLSNLEELYQKIKNPKQKTACIINKYDLNKKISKQIINYLKNNNIVHLCSLPYNQGISDENTINSKLNNILSETCNKIVKLI